MIKESGYQNLWKILVVIAICFSVYLSGGFIYNQVKSARQNELNIMMKVYEKNMLLLFEENLNLAYDMEILVNPDNLEIANIDAMAQKLLLENPGVKYISLIIGDKIQQAWPQDMNSVYAGEDISNLPYMYVLSKVKGELVIEGPVDIQGRSMFLFLQPIKQNGNYWGQVVVGMDESALLKGLNLSIFKSNGYDYQIWKVDSQNGGKDIIATSSKNVDFSNADKLSLYLPAEWNFLIIPENGWVSFGLACLIYGIFVILGIMIGILIFFIHRNYKQKKELSALSKIDYITKMYNYNGFIEELDDWINKDSNPFSLIYFVVEGYGHVAPMIDYQEEINYLCKASKAFHDTINNKYIAGRIGDGRFVVAIRDEMEERELNDLAKALALDLIWSVRLDNRKVFLEAKFQYAVYPVNGLDGKSLISYLSVAYYQMMKDESPIQSLIAKVQQLANGVDNVIFDKYTDVQMMQLSMAINQYRKQAEQIAYTDSVFQIGNRIKYLRDAKMLISYDKKRRFSLYCIDIVSFGSFNELFNVQTGDMVLKIAIQRLSVLFSDYLYRINGDVFLGIYFPGNEVEDSVKMIDNIQNQLQEPMYIGTTKLSIKVNIGVSLYPQHAKSAEVLLEQVQVALRYAKNSNDHCIIYNGDLLNLLRKENEIYELLNESIQNQTLELWYQPLMDYHNNTYPAVEALIRLKGNDGKYIPADHVIEIAERRGIMEKVGDYILEKACCFYKKHGEVNGIDRLGINVSVQQFMVENSAQHILSIIEGSGIKTSSVSLEITETVLIQSLKHMEDVLNILRKQGIHIILDDFGVGYSSLNYLSNLPVDGLKVDRSLTASVVRSEKQLTLLHAIVNIAKINNLRIVAEGVETKLELEQVKKCDVDLIQGYFYSKPLSEEHLIKLLKKYNFKEKEE